MDRKVDRAGEKRLLDFFGEQPLAAGLCQRPVLDGVASGADHLDFDALEAETAGFGEAALHLARLHQRQRGTARTDTYDGRLCHRLINDCTLGPSNATSHATSPKPVGRLTAAFPQNRD